MNSIVIYGGGTFSPVRNHFSLCAPAFGGTAKQMGSIFKDYYNLTSEIVLTKMADPNSKIITNQDLWEDINLKLNNPEVKCIVLSSALCDYDVDDAEAGWHGERLLTVEGNISLDLKPSEKIIDKIRRLRPDIFLVGFKTTTNKSSNDQFSIGLKMMKRSKCNLVLANDTITRHNIIITPEETYYGAGDRNSTIKELCEMIVLRYDLTYSRSNLIDNNNVDIKHTPQTFQEVIHYLVENGGFIENNGNGFTPGHFCYRNMNNGFLCSQRKADHNLVYLEGMSQVMWEDDKIYVSGKRKASVGATSQRLLLESNPEYDCIVHTHNPIKPDSVVNVVEQKPYQCGSLECGVNTLEGLGDYGICKAVYLNKHGINILFNSKTPSRDIIQFIKDNVQLGVKVK